MKVKGWWHVGVRMAAMVATAGTLAGCGRTREKATQTAIALTVTRPAATATATETPVRATRIPPSAGPVDDMAATQAAEITLTPTVTPSPTPTAVPEGVMALLFYPPLVVEYDPAVWRDVSVYTEPPLRNRLQLKALPACYIGVQGPTDFNAPHDHVLIELGEVTYGRLTFPDAPAFAFYLAENFADEAQGIPVLGVSSGEAEWEECQVQAERVLATLRRP